MSSRPFGVTLVAIIAWVTGAIQIVGGIVSLFGNSLAAGLTAIVIGIITIAVSLGLFRGSNGARIVVTIVFILNIAASLYLVFALNASVWGAVGAIVLPVIGLILLYTGRANSFFRH